MTSDDRTPFLVAADDALELVEAAGHLDFPGFADRFDRIAAKGGAAVPLTMFLMAKLAAHEMQRIAEANGVTPQDVLQGTRQYVLDWLDAMP